MSRVDSEPDGSADVKVLSFFDSGQQVFELTSSGGTYSISGQPESDFHVKDLDSVTYFLQIYPNRGETGVKLTVELSDGQREYGIPLGSPVKVGSLNFLACLVGSGSTSADARRPDIGSGFFQRLAHWMSRPMSSLIDLRSNLQDFLASLIASSPALNGMLVLVEPGGYNLVSTYGLSFEDAEKLWNKMPSNLGEDILKYKTRVLVPKSLQEKCSDDTTILIDGIRSFVGFPVMAEEQLVGIMYFGFDNLLMRFSHDVQENFEAAAYLLGVVIQRAHMREQIESLRLSAPRATADEFPDERLMVGSSSALAEVYRLIMRFAPVNVATLITGETGTGKELAAKELHRLSHRCRGAFVIVNSAALPEPLIEAELFGHRRGAFTGALSDRQGLIERSDGGTLFIDEIGELSLHMQVKLLRVLQEHSLTRVGESAARSVDFRLVAATHRNLENMVSEGTFREDLYYRIAGAVIDIPPLRERSEDIVPLANHFLSEFARRHGLLEKSFSTEGFLALEAHDWRGNVRELQNIVSRAFVMAEGSIISRSDLGLEAAEMDQKKPPLENFNLARDHWTRTYIVSALNRHRGHRGETAKALGIGERTLFRYIEQLGIREKS